MAIPFFYSKKNSISVSGKMANGSRTLIEEEQLATWKIFFFDPADKHSPFLAILALNLVVAVNV